MKQNVRESVLGIVRRVEEGMCCYQVRQDSAEGERSTGSVHKCHIGLLTFEDYSQKVIKVTVVEVKSRDRSKRC